ncbi:MAG: DUF4494 domain-containing protein [Prevotellaceae bacterium]|jgi:hypothetical protein|nr:DUF4494 domain-containing protein [Prevotellaceae bacterium]
MYTWFECKVAYDKIGEDGLLKRAVDSYLVDALSFSEAEKRIIEKVTPFVSGELTVSNIKRAKIAELFYNEEGDRWFRCKIFIITQDDETKTVEKRSAQMILVQATSLKKALDVLTDRMKDTMSNYEINLITETALLDVFPYEVPDLETRSPITEHLPQ